MCWRVDACVTRSHTLLLQAATALRLHGKRANCALAEILPLNAESVVEPGPVVLPGDCRGQLDQLGFVEVLPQADEQRIRHLHRALRHPSGVFENESFQIREVQARPVSIEISYLLGSYSAFSAHGRAD